MLYKQAAIQWKKFISVINGQRIIYQNDKRTKSTVIS